MNPIVGINLGPSESWNGNAPFANARRMFRRWGSVDQPWNPAAAPALDANKYPLAPGGAFGELSGYPAGGYAVSFAGDAKLYLNTSTDPLPAHGATIYPTPAAPTTLTLRAGTLADLTLLSPDAKPGDTFRPAFLADLAPAKVIRFMDPMAVNNSSVKTWADRAKPDDWCATIEDYDNPHLGGWSYEDAITLCNTIGAEPWFCIPDQADDNYSHQLARLIKATLKPGVMPRIEWSNEVWNWQFQQYQRVKAACGKDLGSLEFFNFWAGKIAAVKRAFDAEGCPLKLVVASQCGSWITEQLLTALKATGIKGDVLAIGPYLGGLATFPGQDTAKTVDDLFAGAYADLNGVMGTAVKDHAAIAKREGMELDCYEWRPLAFEDATNFDLKVAAQSDPRAGQLTRDFFNNLWLPNGGGAVCFYYYRGPWAAGEIWGIRDSAPIWGAFCDLAGAAQPPPPPPPPPDILKQFAALRIQYQAKAAEADALRKQVQDRDDRIGKARAALGNGG